MTPERQQIIPNLPFDEYKEIDAVNQSSLKYLERSPGYMQWRLANPWEPSAAAIKGSAIDCLITEPAEFERRYASPDPSMLGKKNSWLKEGIAWKAEQRAAGVSILLPDDMAEVRGAAAAVLSYEPAARLIHEASAQDSIVWTDKETQLRCKGRTDLRIPHPSDPTTIDVKSMTLSIDPETMGREVFKRRVHWQLAYYCDGLTAITGIPHDDARIIAVEQAPPHRVEVYLLPLSILEQGREEYRTMLQMYAECKTNNHWPVSSGRELMLEFPAWATR